VSGIRREFALGPKSRLKPVEGLIDSLEMEMGGHSALFMPYGFG
jgi:hypothetical protein